MTPYLCMTSQLASKYSGRTDGSCQEKPANFNVDVDEKFIGIGVYNQFLENLQLYLSSFQRVNVLLCNANNPDR